MFRLARTVCILLAFPLFAAAQETEVVEPKDANEYRDRGKQRLEEGDIDAAIQDFNRAIELDPKDATAYQERGSAFLLKGDHAAAINDLTESIRLNPMDNVAFLNRGMAFFLKGDDATAIKDLTESIRLNPYHARAYYNRGGLFSKNKDYDAAIKDLSEAIRINPTYRVAYTGRARALFFKGDYEAAISDYTKAINLDPKESVPIGSLAWLYATCPDAKFRDGKKAIELATKSCELANWGEYDCDILAAAYAEAGDWENAVKRQEQAIELARNETDNAKKQHRLDQFQKHLALYVQKKPYREKPVEAKAASREATPPAKR